MIAGISGHGANLGHGWVKYVVIDGSGRELPPAVFPAMIGAAGPAVAGALRRIDAVQVGDRRYWTGDDALMSAAARTLISQERLSDRDFIPALVAGALQRLGHLNGAARGLCVTGLPAAWASDREKGLLLGQRMRESGGEWTDIRVIPEPVGMVYGLALDNNGQLAGDPALRTGQIGVVDLGHHTDDALVIKGLQPIPDSLITFQTGTAQPLQRVRSFLAARSGRELSLYETDQAVRARSLRVAGREGPLPSGWDAALIANGVEIASRLVELWGSGAHLDAILLGGGGAELEAKTAPIIERFPHAMVVREPQLAIARGYARLARRLAQQQARA